MDLWPPHIYRSVGQEKGLSPEIIEQLLRTAHRVQNQGLPPVISLKHLARHVGVSYQFLRAVVARRRPASYMVFKVKKFSGGDRTICVPERRLLRAQKWIAKHILSRVPAHSSCFSYSPGSSPLACAKVHCGCKWLIKLDVREFFESVSEIQVYRAFVNVGYAPLVAFELARICTRRREVFQKHNRGVWLAELRKYSAISDYGNENAEHAWLGHLPQGAPTSPMLSNLTMVHFDREVQARSDSLGFHYTRYSDDLIFSSSCPKMSRKIASSLISSVFRIMKSNGLRPHTTKTVVAPPGARKIVLGLLVDRPVPRLTQEFKSRLKQHFYYIKKHGASAHAKKRNFDTVCGLRNHLQGILSYAGQVDPDFVVPYLEQFNQIEWQQ